jgi:hypothetical protein
MGLADVYIALVALALLAASAQQEMQAGLYVERTVQYQGLLPVAGDYVRYEITVTNTGSSAIEGQKLWVDFAPAGEGGDGAAFAVPEIAPGASAQIHAGPFKMHAAGEHLLALGMNRQGDRALPDDVALDITGQVEPVTAYSRALATALPAGTGLVAAGIGFIIWHFVRRRPNNLI